MRVVDKRAEVALLQMLTLLPLPGVNPASSAAQRRQEAQLVLPAVFGGRFDDVARIDMRYPNGFAVRWREDAGEAS